MLRERLMERLPAAEIEAAAREVAERRRDPYSIVKEWLERVAPNRDREGADRK
jgi:hypothetical protein